MIKGINRQVVEVTETDSEYFEKILFFVKPEYASLSTSKLKEQARKITALSGNPPKQRKKGSAKHLIILCVALSIITLAVSIFIISSL